MVDGAIPLDVVSIDNLPSVLAEEASYAFADLLLPALLEYPTDKGWAEAENVRVRSAYNTCCDIACTYRSFGRSCAWHSMLPSRRQRDVMSFYVSAPAAPLPCYNPVSPTVTII